MDIGATPWRTKVLWIASVIVLAGCASPRYRAPVEDRGKVTVPSVAAAPNAEVPRVDAKPAAPDTPAKPPFVIVKAGDTLIRIAADAGQNWRDVARWNNITNPDLLELGQSLRVQPPDVSAVVEAGPVAAKPVVTGRVESRSLDTRPVEPSKPADAKPADAKPADAKPAEIKPVEAAVPAKPADVKPSDARAAEARPSSPPAAAATSPPVEAAPNGTLIGDDAMPWIWPASGSIGAAFDGPRQKGVTILGKAGDPVVAAADGRVIYAGSSLRGYGNIVIIKHNNTYITAYAHNRTLLVKEEQAVRRGQRIAEMGSTDAERVQLHFELRRNGVAVDPMKHLPAR
jgi:lipoprotein NlpD